MKCGVLSNNPVFKLVVVTRTGAKDTHCQYFCYPSVVGKKVALVSTSSSTLEAVKQPQSGL